MSAEGWLNHFGKCSSASLLPLIVDLFTATSQSHVAPAISDTRRKAAINQQLS
jgi:hypothetical protein